MLQNLTPPHFDEIQYPNSWIVAILKIKILTFDHGQQNPTPESLKQEKES